MLMAVQSAHATEAGIDAGWVVANGEPVDRVAVIDTLGVRWVRVNFRLDAWASPADPTPHGTEGMTWFAAYDRAIDAFIARGYQVYGLINDEAVATDHPHGSAPWIADYVANATQIIDHFKDRVRVYEIINEPNDWAGGSSSRVSPRAFASILQDTYLAVKRDHADDRCWQVDLVSGALFSFDDNSSDDYLAQVYAIGRTELAWDYTREVTGSFPLDGIGYHIYAAQGSDSPVSDVGASMRANLAAIRSVVAANDVSKPLYVSEWGFRADAVGDQGQADRLEAGFDALHAEGDVALGLYFSLQDFPDNPWGVFDDAMNRRPSADRLAEVGAVLGPPRGAAVIEVATSSIEAGQLGEITVTLENRGTGPWSSDVRLGAATGCPDAAGLNELSWEPDAGYANGIADARVFLDREVAPGEVIEVRVPVRAPSQAGTYAFAARMVQEGVEWFGATAKATIDVTNSRE
ncbi:MAG: cellulase family glycosylhydrolase, partial [Deltaproteobacteria bacterium]|nr:cellulase family glycosylhydrolase [Deltaproteobacteria bacterium]